MEPLKTVVTIQHVSAEPIGTVGDALAAAGLRVQPVRVDLGEPIPVSTADCDALVIMGGPMGVYEADRHAFLRDELRLIEDALRRERPILGICLGSQLLAAALGARVFASGRQEIGWAPIQLSAEAFTDPLFRGLPATFTAFHWHGDTFDLPAGAVRLGSSALTREQGFRYGPRAWSLQYHLEVTGDVVRAMVQGAEAELARAGSSPAVLLDGLATHGAALERVGATVFARWAGLA